jgi:hypothetical protein
MQYLGLFLAVALIAAIGFILFSPMFKRFRTQIAAALTAGIGGLLPALHDWAATALPYANDVVVYLKDLDWRQYLSPQFAPYAMIGLGVLFYILRRMTNTAPGVKT